MDYTKENIQEKMTTDIRWTERAVLVLFDRQTEDEQKIEDTVHNNGVGFNGVDGKYLTWVGNYLMRGNHLSGHHVEKVRKKLPKYWKQIKNIIEEKESVT